MGFRTKIFHRKILYNGLEYPNTPLFPEIDLVWKYQILLQPSNPFFGAGCARRLIFYLRLRAMPVEWHPTPDHTGTIRHISPGLHREPGINDHLHIVFEMPAAFAHWEKNRSQTFPQ